MQTASTISRTQETVKKRLQPDDLEKTGNPVLERLAIQMRKLGQAVPSTYSRMHNRHNRS